MSVSPDVRRDSLARLRRARAGAVKISQDLDLGYLLEEAQAAPNSYRYTWEYGSAIIVLSNTREHRHLGPMVADPTQEAVAE